MLIKADCDRMIRLWAEIEAKLQRLIDLNSLAPDVAIWPIENETTRIRTLVDEKLWRVEWEMMRADGHKPDGAA
jgi:hypothetical protein